VKRFSALQSCECIHGRLQRVEFSEKTLRPAPRRRVQGF
jgi:acylphosphatase